MDKIVILDFGGQSTQLIGRRIRQLGIYSDIVRGDAALPSIDLAGARGLILSGSPYSVYEPEAPAPDKRIYGLGLPILGICYGLQRVAADNGGVWPPWGARSTAGRESR
jgi:GMP synthase (glutamine-hydrolysing)